MLWTRILSLVPIKYVMWMLAVGGLVLLLGLGYNRVYDAGYEHARQEMAEENIAAINKAVERARAEWRKSVKVAEAQLNHERNLLERINELEAQIDFAVNSVGSDCRVLGDDILRLFNAAVEAANGVESSDSSESDETVR